MQKTVQAYGCFVDVGADNNGLVHISQLSDTFVKDVNDVVQVGQTITVRVLSLDGDKRLSLTMKSADAPERAPRSAPSGDRDSRSGGAGGRGDGQRAGQRRSAFQPKALYIDVNILPPLRRNCQVPLNRASVLQPISTS